MLARLQYSPHTTTDVAPAGKDGPKTVITSLEVQRAVKAVLPGSGERPEADGKRVPLRPPPLPAVVKRARQMDKVRLCALVAGHAGVLSRGLRANSSPSRAALASVPLLPGVSARV